jgi:rubrerythrin
LTVKSDLQKALASAKSAEGSYSMFAESTDDQTAKQMFQQMANDSGRHVQMIQNRLDYLNAQIPSLEQSQQAQQLSQANLENQN